MLTTNLDGLWILQVLCGIEVIAPELGLRPHLPSVETANVALGHPMARELRAAGILTPDGAVDSAVHEWLTVLGHRDLALLLHIQTPTADGAPEQVMLARFDRWWVALERCGDVVRLSGAGEARNEDSAGRLISRQIERLCGPCAPVALRPVTLDADELVANVNDEKALRRMLLRSNLDGDQRRILALAGDRERSAQASLVAVQADWRPHSDAGVVTIIDTPAGRVLSEHVTRGTRHWMVLRPGSPSAIGVAVRRLLRRLPARHEWYSHRKAV